MAQGEVKFEKLVLIGGSAGSLDVLLQMLPVIHVKFRFPIVVVLHRKMSNDSPLVELLSVKTLLTVKEVEEKERILPGTIYVAPADYHLLFEKDGSFSLDVSEKINYSRPSIDVVFESAAEVYADKVVAILLSGANADGTQGFRTIKQYGGVTLAQDPATAEISYMPDHAIRAGVADHVPDIAGIAEFLNKL